MNQVSSLENVQVDEELLGGWKVFRQRTDKTANAIKTAESIIKTIQNPVYEDELRGLLEDLSSVSFEPTSAVQDSELGKRRRAASNDEADECF